MLAVLLGDSDALTPLKGLIIERTEGNPFFMEEMVQALFEQGVLARNGAVRLNKQLGDIRVPPTVQGVLASRIDRLPSAEKELLQTLAVLGREFPLALIKRVTGKPDTELEQMLSHLQLGEFIYEQPATADVEYQFKHALTQEVAYNSVLTERRRSLHERAAQAIEALYAESLEDHLPELARHYDCAGNVAKAVQYQGRAGRRAAQQMAHPEAIGYLSRALESLKRLPEGTDRDRQELDLQVELGWSLFVLNPASAERELALLRTQQLGENLGDSTRLMEAILALGHLRQARHEFGWARELAQKALALAEAANAQPTVAGGHSILGMTLVYMGELQAAREHLEFGVAPLGAGPLQGFAEVTYVRGAAVALPATLLLLGYPDSALRINREFLKARLSDPVWTASNLLGDALLHCQLRDSRSVQKRAEELLSIASEHGIFFHITLATFLRGWAFADQGRNQEGIAEMLRNIPTFGGWHAQLAESFGKNARPEEGLAVVAEALREGERTGERMFQARLYGIQGELTLMRNPSDEAQAERSFRTAIEIARRQSARFYELRATVSLGRLLKRQDKTEEAREMLRKIYNWFTEGFEFSDLKDAKALLQELGA
jgi:tetratricopeptide (TPR) repeat protein